MTRPHETLETPVQFVRGIGPERARALDDEGIRTLRDLLLVLPRRYEDRTRFAPIKNLRPGERVVFEGWIAAASVRRARRMPIFEAVIEDSTGRIPCVFFGQAYLRESLKPGKRVIVFGAPEVDRYARRLALSSPEVEVVDDDGGIDEAVHMNRIVPVYEKRAGVTPKLWRRIVTHAIRGLDAEAIADPLPEAARESLGVVGLIEALRSVHDPGAGSDPATLEACRSAGHLRLILEEFFLFSLGLSARRLGAEPGVPLRPNDHAREAVKKILPFPLTAAQKRVAREISQDLESGRRMNRLLQGDVGAGKTLVAALAMILAAANDAQSALIAPTEVLAEQHAMTLGRLLAPAGLRVAYVGGRLTAKERRTALADLATGGAEVAVGTHALLESDVLFRNLALAIVDEQHRFGVLQRDALRAKGRAPHALVMTATPIPRTLALSIYGDLETSVLDQKPPGRSEIPTTHLFETQRATVVDAVRRRIARGEQAFVVAPLIEASEKLQDVRAATRLFEEWSEWLGPGVRVGLLHGRMKRDEKAAAMADLVAGKTEVLVSTTVIEVGVDVANATIMVIEHAERFGIAQLHQLRGRVGRGRVASECILVTAARLNDVSRARIDALVASNDGFLLAEKDLELRGHGEFFGTRQSGRGFFQAADIVRDRDLLVRARAAADEWWRGAPEGDALRAFARGAAWTERFGLSRVG